ncbi:MAG: hypothetical protein JRJ49_03605 [Deltaproteobacteria bacterium]|nr:hypothetical protein [Deltaproteobacteria bacterium]
MISSKKEFGGFQTPFALSSEVISFVKNFFPEPTAIIEPTCGLGSFIKAAITVWNKGTLYYGFDINKDYITKLKNDLNLKENLYLYEADFFLLTGNHFLHLKRLIIIY